MSNSILSFILCLFSTIIISQNNYEITFEITPIEADKKSQLSSGEQAFFSVIENAGTSLKLMEPVLLLNKNASLFRTDLPLSSDVSQMNNSSLAYTLFGLDKIIYNDLITGSMYETLTIFGERIQIENRENPFQWKITSNEKMIGDFKAYKATTTKIVVNSKGTFEFEVEAWFTPSITNSSGPLGYFGLPGLILEISEYSAIPYNIKVKKIKVVEDLCIDNISSGKLISKEQYSKIVKKGAANFKAFLNN